MKMLFIDAEHKTVKTVDCDPDNINEMLNKIGECFISTKSVKIDDEICVVGYRLYDCSLCPLFGFEIGGYKFSGNGLWYTNPNCKASLRDPDDLEYQIKFFTELIKK